MSPHHRAVSRFLPIEPIRACYLRFIFRKRFVPLPPLEPKPMHWIHTITVGHPPWIAQLPPSTLIERSSQLWSLSPPLNRVSIFPPPYSEHHAIGAPPTSGIPFHHHLTPIVPLHNDTYGGKLADPLFLPGQLIDMWIYVKNLEKKSQMFFWSYSIYIISRLKS
jgi:hypothetical protein